MKKYSTLKTYKPLKRGNGFKKTTSKLKRSSFKRTLNTQQNSIKEADSKFSKFIINRDGKCLRCGSTSFLTCSHYYGRAIYATRFNALNCITLCVSCHDLWESKKSGVYKEFMEKWLGEDIFNTLEQLSKTRVSKEEALFFAQPIINPIKLEIEY